MSKDEKSRVEVVVRSGLGWGTGWLFTIGYADLGFWKAVLGLLIWPLQLGQELSS